MTIDKDALAARLRVELQQRDEAAKRQREAEAEAWRQQLVQFEDLWDAVMVFDGVIRARRSSVSFTADPKEPTHIQIASPNGVRLFAWSIAGDALSIQWGTAQPTVYRPDTIGEAVDKLRAYILLSLPID
jgi:hypothetical protein